MPGQPIIIRTLDVGGDKFDAAISLPKEPNPFLGMRAIRLGLSRPELLKNQLRALLRAGVFGDIKILFPMVSSVEELDGLLNLLEQLKDELRERELDFRDDMEIGIMIEIPSAALIADQLAKKADFFSIGSNDLVQYTLAVDRTNERLNYLDMPTHPAVLTLIANCIAVARKHNIPVSVCGQIAGDPRFTPLLVGLGVNELSMPPALLGPVRRVIRKLQMADAELAALQVLECETSAKALDISMQMLRNAAPEIAELIVPENKE